jgi:putative DNA primase/helicase
MVLHTGAVIPTVESDIIPDELKQSARWCVWKATPTSNGTLTKKPFIAGSNQPFSKTTAAHYRPFSSAVEAYKNDPSTDGIGWVCGDGIVGVDFDNCFDFDGNLIPQVAEIVERMGTYAERSPSGRGVRAFLKGSLPDGKSVKSSLLELMGSPNYVTLTGNVLDGSPRTIAEGSVLIPELCRLAEQSKEADKAARRASRGKPARTRTPAPTALIQAVVASDDEVLARARRCGGSTVDRLLNGQWDEYESQSQADLALANHLAYVAGIGGEAQVERLLLSSGLNREKWQEPRDGGTYLTHYVVRPAFDGRTEFYDESRTAAPVALPNGIASTGPTRLDDASTLTEIGLARRLVHEANGTLRYVRETHSWLAWTGKVWKKDDGLAAAHIAKQVSDQLWREMADLRADEDRRRVLQFVKSSSSARAVDAAVRLARSEPGVVISVTDLDQHPYLLNVRNGTVDLRELVLLPHTPGHLITHMAEVDFDPLAKCPTWERFIKDVTGGNDELAAFLQRSCGLALSGDVTEQSLWLHYGEGRNGKSTLLTVLSDMLGSYAGPAPMDLLLVKSGRGKEVETQFANLAGKRLVTTVEADSGVRFSEATVKLLTGGDTVLARRLYEDSWPLKPTWKLHVAANHKPEVRGQDEGIWRRLLLTPWLVRFDGQREDKKLKEKLQSEFSGILGWCLFGFSQWGNVGLAAPECVANATTEYRDENDVLGSWMDECCTINPSSVAEAGALYRSFKNWADDRGEHAGTATAFGLRLERLGYRSERPSGGTFRRKTIRRGIGLLSSRHHDD